MAVNLPDTKLSKDIIRAIHNNMKWLLNKKIKINIAITTITESFLFLVIAN
ncbi:hypothetical protein BN1088_1431698 [Sphingobacterium sp. PM2-P1-29]|nr:hypothetical protein BN1088_1431698 [Sphingobacterium sp. PM2-P1-29]